MYNYIDKVKSLLNNLNLDINIRNKYEQSLLVVTCIFANINIVNKLFEFDSLDVNLQDKFQNTSLIYTSEFGKIQTMKLLLKHPNIMINIRGKYGFKAIDIVSERFFKTEIRNMLTEYQEFLSLTMLI